MSQKIVILGMGGTIAGVASNALQSVHYQSGQLSVAELLGRTVAHDNPLPDFALEAEQVQQLDSKDMEFSHGVLLAQRVVYHLSRQDVAGIVITHGTDTLEETAFFLSNVLPRDLLSIKSVVITCAMRPATALMPDGVQNIRDALVVAAEDHSSGIVVVCAGVVHAAEYVQKVHTYRLDAFESVGACPLGYVEDGRLRWVVRDFSASQQVTSLDLSLLQHTNWPKVEIVMNYIGADGAIVRALCTARQENGLPLVQGLIVAGTGNGTLSQSLEAALLDAQSQGVKVLRCSRCIGGQVVQPHDFMPLIAVSPVASPVKARIALILSMLNTTFP